MAFDYDLALAKAEELHTIHTLDLVSWAQNYDFNSPSNPLVAFYALTGIFDYAYSMPKDAVFGYVELDYLANALKEYANRPDNVEQLLNYLDEMEAN